MKDLFDLIIINEPATRGRRSRPKAREELSLESDALFEAMGGNKNDSQSDRRFFDLDHEIASSRSNRSRNISLEELDQVEGEYTGGYPGEY